MQKNIFHGIILWLLDAGKRSITHLGFLLKGVPETEPLFQAVKQYSAAFGFAYQIADDLEDEAQDQINSKKNILSFLGREAAIELARKQILQSSVQANFHASEYLLSKLKTDFQLV